MKKELHSILKVENDNSPLSKTYNIINIVLSIISLIPLLFNEQTDSLLNIEAVVVIFFVIDYLLRWYTADIHYSEKSPVRAYLTYPFSLFAIIDMLAILPFLTFFDQTLRLFRLFRLTRSLRVFRAFRLFRHSKGLEILIRTIKKQKEPLIIVGVLTFSYIFIAALLVFNVEPETFPSFLQALLWATSGLTTATYGDIYPTSTVGQILSIFSYLVGVGVIALPSSIITAGYVAEMEKDKIIKTEEDEKVTKEE